MARDPKMVPTPSIPMTVIAMSVAFLLEVGFFVTGLVSVTLLRGPLMRE